MESNPPVFRQSFIKLRCDPWGPVLTRLVFCSVCGWLALDNATMFKPWSPGTDWAGILFALAVIGAGLWGVVGWLASALTIDRVTGRFVLDRMNFWAQSNDEPRSIPLEAIEAVVLTPQRRTQLILPNRIELRLRDGEKVPVSTICSNMWGMAIQAKRIAAAIGCRYEEQAEPDPKRKG